MKPTLKDIVVARDPNEEAWQLWVKLRKLNDDSVYLILRDVLAQVRESERQEEREACAKVANSWNDSCDEMGCGHTLEDVAQEISFDIRTRSTTGGEASDKT